MNDNTDIASIAGQWPGNETDAEIEEALGVDLSRCFDGMQLLDESSVCNTCPYRELFRNE